MNDDEAAEEIFRQTGLSRLIKRRMNDMTKRTNYYVRDRRVWPRMFDGIIIQDPTNWFTENLLEEATRFCEWLRLKTGRPCALICREAPQRHRTYLNGHSIYLNIEIDSKVTLFFTRARSP